MNKLLLRQIAKHWGSIEKAPDSLASFFQVISETYDFHDKDRSMLERTIELSSDEMVALNTRLRNESKELARAQQELNTLLNNIDTVFFTVDVPNSRLIQMSPSCEKIYGYTQQDFLENPELWFSVVPEEDKHLIERNYPVMHAGKAFSHEHRIVRKDGEIRWVETKITPTLADEKVIRIDGITIDITARKLAEELSQQNEIRFSKLIEKSHDGITLMDDSGKLIYTSPAVQRILGYGLEDFNGEDPFELVHPEDRETLAMSVTELRDCPGCSIRSTYRVRHNSGAWRWISANITNLLKENSINALVFNFQDITDRVEAQKEREFERRNRDALINSTTDLMWSFDADCKLVTANRAFLQSIKYMSKRELRPGDDLLDFRTLPPATLRKWEKLYQRVLSGESFFYENHETYPVPIWGELSFNPIIEKGKVIGGSCFWRDITEKKRNNERLIASERMMAEAQRISRLGSWEYMFDESGNIAPGSVKWSDEVFRIHGYDPATHIPDHKDNEERVHAQDRRLLSEWHMAVLNGEAPGSVDYRIYTTEGQLRWVKTTADLVINEETGKRLKMVGTVQDITERKALERERGLVTKDLLHRNKALEQFAYIVSHNLRAPVANILGLSNLMRITDKNCDTYDQCINGFTLSARRLDDIIKDLNKILQVKRGMSEEKNMVNLDHLVNNIKDSIQMTIDEERVLIHTDFTEVGELFTIKNYLHSIFYNLISNSIKYRKPMVPPLIQIKSHVSDGKTILTFSDNGTGIDLEKYGESVFGLYKRFHFNVEGKGVGMYMVKTQAEALGGKVGIKSAVNQGTEVTLEFPTEPVSMVMRGAG